MPDDFAVQLPEQSVRLQRAPSTASEGEHTVAPAGSGSGSEGDLLPDPGSARSLMDVARPVDAAESPLRPIGTGSSGDAGRVWARSAAAGAVGDSDALRILLQASAAAESLQQRFTELQQRRAELTAEHQQLEADRRAFESRAREFAASVAENTN